MYAVGVSRSAQKEIRDLDGVVVSRVVAALSRPAGRRRNSRRGRRRSGAPAARLRPSHAAPAFRLGARFDLAHALAGQAEDLADVAEGQLVVLQHAVAQL